MANPPRAAFRVFPLCPFARDGYLDGGGLASSPAFTAGFELRSGRFHGLLTTTRARSCRHRRSATMINFLFVVASIQTGMIAALAEMYARGFPIRSMYRVDRFGWSGRLHGGDDYRSMAAGNTSAFNCRPSSSGRAPVPTT